MTLELRTVLTAALLRDPSWRLIEPYLPGGRGFECNRDITPFEMTPIPVAAQIASGWPTTHPESSHLFQRAAQAIMARTDGPYFWHETRSL